MLDPVLTQRIATRLQQLEATYRRIAVTRMRGVPVLHSALSVQAVGFVLERPGPVTATSANTAAATHAPVLHGILVTPWFMNVLRLPLAEPWPDLLPVGALRTRQHGDYALDYLGAHEPTLGPFEQASLYSPMFVFADQPAAVATAQEVLTLLRHAAPVAPVRTATIS